MTAQMKKPAQGRANPNHSSVAAQQHHSTAAASDPLMPQAFELVDYCSGMGQYHSDGGSRPRPLDSIMWASVIEMMKAPPSVAKGQAQWAIFSSLATRSAEKQRAEGCFYTAWVDLDETPTTFADALHKAAEAIPGDTYGYTSRSATKEKQKARLLFPLAEMCSGAEFEMIQEIINDRLAAAGLTPDRATERANQVCYLPNRGEFYESDSLGLSGPLDWRDELAREIEAKEVEAEQARQAFQAAHEEARRKRQARLTKLTEGQISPVDAYNELGSVREGWEARGAKMCGRRALSPNSTSGSPAILFNEELGLWYSWHECDADIGQPGKSGGRWGDCFDLFVHDEHGGDFNKAVQAAGDTLKTTGGVTINKHNQRLYMQAQAEEAAVVTFGSAVSTEAQKLADRIHQSLLDMLQVEADTDMTDRLKPDALRISDTIRGAFWSGSKSKVFLLTHSDTLAQFSAQDAPRFLARTFGAAIDRMAVAEAALGMDFGHDPKADEKREKHVKAVMAAAQGEILDHLKYCNQRDSIEWRVDMFAKQSHMLLTEDNARVVLKHDPFPVAGTPDNYERIVEDYKQHFPRFEEFLRFLVAARFAKDRKKAYLWILADSDWGKGFLMNGVLGEGNDGGLGAQVETSVKEVEAMFEGKPVGKSPEDFKRQFALVVDEFKSVKSEIKQLQSHLTLAPKHQLSCTVELFAKVFTSAESVGSLVTENGVEDQFANRMSIFAERGSIEHRDVWQEVGKSRYLKSIRAYAARMINAGVEDYRRLGREESQTQADRWLDGFIQRNGLDTLYDRFSESLPRVADEIIHWLEDPQGFFPTGGEVVKDTASGITYLKSPGKVVERYIEQHFDSTEAGAYRKRKPEILRHMSADGKGVYPHRPNGRQVKCVMLKQTGQAYVEASQGW